MKFVLLMTFAICSTAAFAQDDVPSTDQTRSRRQRNAPKPLMNPFDPKYQASGGSGMMEGMDMGMDSMGGMDDMGMGMGEMGMEEYAPSPDELFRDGMARAIVALKKANSDKTKETIRGYIRSALNKRYDRQMTDRKKDITRLREAIADLERDLSRRVAAKDRVVELQLQSAQLAAEGLLDVEDYGDSNDAAKDMSGGMGGGGMF